MDTRKTRTWAEVSLGALRHNVEEMQRALPDGCGLLGVVKADAYGHGASEIAAALREWRGCRIFRKPKRTIPQSACRLPAPFTQGSLTP